MEMPVATSPELLDALRHDRRVLVRETILWQRWLRYAGLLSVLLLVLVVNWLEHRTGGMGAIAGVCLAYVLCVAITTSVVRRATTVHERWIPGLLVSADVLALSTLLWLSGGSTDTTRILVAGVLLVQLTVFYFGRTLGSYTALLSAAAYVVVTVGLSSGQATARPSQVAFSLSLFGLVSTMLVMTYGGFRARMNRLRLFCKLVEEGDLAPAVPLSMEKWPDDLTLLARSFEAMRGRLAEQIGTDPLTGCLNRRALETRLAVEWRQAKRRGSTVAVLALDLDHFKQINDTRGHPFGDIVLQELAGIMKATARDTDAVARLGGDEFVIVLPDTGWQGALTFAERLRRKVDDFSFGADTVAMSITVSVGVALARGTDPISPDMLLQEADRSLYKAKSGGRNRIFA